MSTADPTPSQDAARAASQRRAGNRVGAVITFTGVVAIAFGLALYWWPRKSMGPGQAAQATVTRIEAVATGPDRVFVRLEDSAQPLEDEFLLPHDGHEDSREVGARFQVWYDRASRPKEVQVYETGVSWMVVALPIAGFFDLIFGLVILNFGLPSEWNQRRNQLAGDETNPYNQR